MITIYHNPRCRKSREGLHLIENSGKHFQIREYLKDSLSSEELSEIVKLLGISPIDLVRKNEAIWKENYRGKELSDSEVIAAMIENPKLIERPIVINSKKAIVGRPPESIKSVL